MRLLLLFLKRHHVTIIFIFLEIIGLLLLSRSNSYHQAKIANAAQSFKGNMASKYASIGAYFGLRYKNELLLKENARLYNLLNESYTDVITPDQIDTSRNKKFVYIPAEVLNNSVNKQSNFITLNRGAQHGIENDMAVIGPNGIVGKVKATTANYSLVISVLNRDLFSPKARIESSNFTGVIEWPGKNYQLVELKDIPTHATYQIGDTIITSGYRSSFPPGIPIGKITKSSIDRGVFLNLTVELFTDFKRLNHVMIVKNNFRNEQIQLEELGDNE